MKKLTMIMILVLFAVFSSCEKEKEEKESIIGQWKAESNCTSIQCTPDDSYFYISINEIIGDSIVINLFEYHNPECERSPNCTVGTWVGVVESHFEGDTIHIKMNSWGSNNYIFRGVHRGDYINGYLIGTYYITHEEQWKQYLYSNDCYWRRY